MIRHGRDKLGHDVVRASINPKAGMNAQHAGLDCAFS
jgi:hypothetical protein